MLTNWWGRMESNHLPKRYEHPALTDELRPHERRNNETYYSVKEAARL
jgi:hypothetical protein